MLALRELQAAFADGLAGRGEGGLVGMIAGDSVSAEGPLRIHRNHVRQSLAAALAATFPTVASLVGGPFFDTMAKAFVAESLPESPVLAEYGVGFPVFVEAFAPARGLPYLADVARLDWVLGQAFHVAHGPRLDAADLEGMSSRDLLAITLRLAPGATLLRSAYPLDRIWQACQPGADPAEVDLAAGGVSLLVMRQDHDAAFALLDEGEAEFIEAIARGTSLGKAAQDAVDGNPLFELSRSFARLLSWRVLAPHSPKTGDAVSIPAINNARNAPPQLTPKANERGQETGRLQARPFSNNFQG